jgi:uncharacterized protein (DUF2267 family)
MDRGRLVSAVPTARIPTADRAETAVHATLKVFGERLAGGETKDLAAQLPTPFPASSSTDPGPGGT